MLPTLGRRLRQLREEQHVTLRDLESLTELSSGYLSLLEHDKVKQPKPPVLYKLAQALAVPYTELMELAGYIPAGEQPAAGPSAIMFKGAERLSRDQREAVQGIINVILESSGRGRTHADDDTG